MDNKGYNNEPLGLKKPITIDWCCKLLAFLYVFGNEGGIKEFVEGCVPLQNDILSAQAVMKKNILNVKNVVVDDTLLRKILKGTEERVGELKAKGYKTEWIKDIETRYNVVIVKNLKIN